MNYFSEVLQDAKDEVQNWEHRWLSLAGQNEVPFILNYRNKVDYFFSTRLPQIHEASGRLFHINPILDSPTVTNIRGYGANCGDYYNVIYLSKQNRLINFVVYPYSESTIIDTALIEKIAHQIDSRKIKHQKNPQKIEYGLFGGTQVGVWLIPQAMAKTESYNRATTHYSANLSEQCVKNYDMEKSLNLSSFSVQLMTPRGRIQFPISSEDDAVPDRDIISQAKAELRNVFTNRVTQAIKTSIRDFKAVLENRFGHDISFVGSAETMNFCLDSKSTSELRGKLDLLKTYPFLNYYVNNPSYNKDSLGFLAAHDVLDIDIAPSCIGKSATIEGMKVAPVLAFQSGTNEAVISRVMGLPEDYYRLATDTVGTRMGGLSFKDSSYLKLLAVCPIGGLPKYNSNPEQFVEVSNTAIAISTLFSHRVDENFKVNFIKASISSAGDITKKYGSDVKTLKAKATDAHKDYLGYLANKLILPTLHRRSLGKISVELWNDNIGLRLGQLNLGREEGAISTRIKNALLQDLFEFKGLGTLLEYSDTMHERFTAIEHVVNDPDVKVGWAKLIEDTAVPESLMGEGYKYVCLNTTEKLQDEGSPQRMNHCVGGYSKNCYAGKSHIISVRDSDNKSMFTMEIVEKHITDAETQITRVEVSLVQARGYNNNVGNPMPANQKTAANWLVDAINSKKVKIDFKAINEERSKYRDEGLKTIIGFSPKDTVRQEEAFREIHKQKLLPRKIKSLEELLNLPRISAEIAEISKALIAKALIANRNFEQDVDLELDEGMDLGG